MAFKFCPHHVSHYLGMDVHDTPSVSRKEKLQPGMVITMEPGRNNFFKIKYFISLDFFIIKVCDYDNGLFRGSEIDILNCKRD